jgi:hypothetical protein
VGFAGYCGPLPVAFAIPRVSLQAFLQKRREFLRRAADGFEVERREPLRVRHLHDAPLRPCARAARMHK